MQKRASLTDETFERNKHHLRNLQEQKIVDKYFYFELFRIFFRICND